MDNPEIARSRKPAAALQRTFAAEKSEHLLNSIRLTSAVDAATLLKKVNQLEKALAHANLEREQVLEKLKDSTLALARVGHDLRQPIHAANLFLSTLRFEKNPQKVLDLVEKIERSLSGIDSLLSQTLDLAQMESGAIAGQSQAFALDPLLDIVEVRFASIAKERGLSWKVTRARGLTVKTDPTIMTEILMNLLSNAFRYTEAGGVLLGVRIRHKSALVQVWDTGMGISKSNLPKIFNDFYQIRDGNKQIKRNSAGTGLGLGIVKRLTAFLGLALNVRSVFGRGSRFELRIPLGDVVRSTDLQNTGSLEFEPIKELLEGSNPVAGSLILVIDNHQDVLLATQLLLSAWGAHVLLARNLAEAVAQIGHSVRLPDVIITDHNFSDQKFGIEVINECRALAECPIPALVQTAQAPEIIEQQYEPITVLRKPVKPSLMFGTICSLLEGSKS